MIVQIVGIQNEMDAEDVGLGIGNYKEIIGYQSSSLIELRMPTSQIQSFSTGDVHNNVKISLLNSLLQDVYGIDQKEFRNAFPEYVI